MRFGPMSRTHSPLIFLSLIFSASSRAVSRRISSWSFRDLARKSEGPRGRQVGDFTDEPRDSVG